MERLTQKDEQGNWSLRGVPWESLYEWQVITRELHDRLYGALWKLMEYEDTGLSPEEVEEVNDFVKSQAGTLLKKLNEEQRKHRWIPVEERLPEDNHLVLLSFENFSFLEIGRYVSDDGGGVFYLGVKDDTCLSQDLFVNAWMPLPKSYREEGER